MDQKQSTDPTLAIRHVNFNDHQANLSQKFNSNLLRTAKYTPLNMIPKALFAQFRLVSNFYFLLVAIVSFIPGVSPTTPIAQVFPLVIVVGFGFARDIYEDMKRSREDYKQNNQLCYILARKPENVDPKKKDLDPVSYHMAQSMDAIGLESDIHRSIVSRDISVGDIVLVRKGQQFPCDLVLLYSSQQGGVAYVSTANLDGESNLKRVVVASATSLIKHPSQLRDIQGIVRTQPPVPALYEFEASATLHHQDPVPLDASNLLLRDSILRNTDYIYGLAVYTGFDTKVALNMRNPPSKMGSVEKTLNWVVFMLFSVLAVFVILSAVISGQLHRRFGADQWYMGEIAERSTGKVTVEGLATFFILYYTTIPVSMFVTLEFIRLIQGFFIYSDFRMKTGNQHAIPRATNLNEMLGEVDHILSDKTGTLTENIMRFIGCSADGKLYKTRGRKANIFTAVEQNVQSVKKLILAMALCHIVVPEVKSDFDDDFDSTNKKKKTINSSDSSGDAVGKKKRKDDRNSDSTAKDLLDENEEPLPEYQGQSPDEVALVSSAREYGIALTERTIDTIHLHHFGSNEQYTVLAELEFNSNRKRMSMILRCPDGRIRMYSKGADSIMLNLIKDNIDQTLIQEHIDSFAKEGFRTLVFAAKEIPEDEYQAWFVRFQDARNSLEDRDSKVAAISEEIEQELDYVGTTAVEDKLQDKVPEVIKFMREAGMRLWVLTGDKRETAENIGYSANLLSGNMHVLHIKGQTPEDIGNQISTSLDRHISGNYDNIVQPSITPRSLAGLVRKSFSLRHARKAEAELGIIIDGTSLRIAMEHHLQNFVLLADNAKVVICCRVTPLQKALVVRMVREEFKSLTLAIGDGGNDVSMIQEAHIGVGIFGKEGTQAARSADYAIGEFKHLLRLTVLHGRYSNLRTAGMINLSFYKNTFYNATLVLFQIYCFFSGQIFNNQWITAVFNVFITSASPFLYGIYERDLDEETVTRFPSVYSRTRDRKPFSVKSVLEFTALYGIWHGATVFFGVYLLFGYLQITFIDGKDSGLFLVGFANATIITFMVLFKMALHSHVLNWIILLAFALSLLLYFAIPPLSFLLIRNYSLEGNLKMLFSSPTFYLAAAVIMVTAFFLDYVVLTGRKLIQPSIVDRLQRWESGYKKI